MMKEGPTNVWDGGWRSTGSFCNRRRVFLLHGAQLLRPLMLSYAGSIFGHDRQFEDHHHNLAAPSASRASEAHRHSGLNAE